MTLVPNNVPASPVVVSELQENDMFRKRRDTLSEDSYDELSDEDYKTDKGKSVSSSRGANTGTDDGMLQTSVESTNVQEQRNQQTLPVRPVETRNATKTPPSRPTSSKPQIPSMKPRMDGGKEREPAYRDLIAIMGSTGSGKSTFINTVSGSNVVEVGHSSDSCTADVNQTTLWMGDHVVALVDTPGFEDTNLSDTDVLRLIANWMEMTYSIGMKLTGIIYLREITETRMKGPARKNLDMFIKLCGYENLKNVVLVTTKWDQVEPETGKLREDNLADKYWKDMTDLGASMSRHDNSRRSGLNILAKVLGKPQITLQLQRELVDEGKKLSETEAGVAINRELIEMEKKMREELTEKLALQQREHNEAVRKIYEKRQKELEELLEKAEQDRLAMELSRDKEMEGIRKQMEDLKAKAEKAGKNVLDYVWSGIASALPKIMDLVGVATQLWMQQPPQPTNTYSYSMTDNLSLFF